MTTIVSIAALCVSVVVGFISYAQMKIGGSKIKLDLYNRRFGIYEAILELFQELHKEKWDDEQIREKEREMIKAFRESKFLFDPADKIYQTIEKIKDANAKITGPYRLHKDFPEGQLDSGVEKRFRELRQIGFMNYEEQIYVLEKQLEKYLSFKKVDGWESKELEIVNKGINNLQPKRILGFFTLTKK